MSVAVGAAPLPGRARTIGGAFPALAAVVVFATHAAGDPSYVGDRRAPTFALGSGDADLAARSPDSARGAGTPWASYRGGNTRGKASSIASNGATRGVASASHAPSRYHPPSRSSSASSTRSAGSIIQ